ncbi:flagellar protein FlgN [Kurthia huakuii]|uniref:flagellar protein FlgN n=1 Tax=Kurthia huakuii TaxID=1421019 RepID=UPI000497AD2E|nr:flagellar protein FlgN [Kurthia huakuii]MBM7700160.1 flagellar biosynthesis/type III secretory pathway chaperone [Kurthia huakuii]
MSIEQINTIMAKLNMMHKSLVKLADHKTELITNGDMDGIKNMINDEQSHISAIAQLESQRQQAVLSYLKGRNVAPTAQPTIEQLIALVPTAQEKTQLRQTSEQLLQTVEQLQQANELNQKLLFNSLQVVNMTIDMMRPQQDNFNYGEAQGKRNPAATTAGRFNSQA